ncbi:malonate-semialdehyde dehydrogenase (acetylating)/methylmalonate-semialdehyde dehydrogenase [Mycoplasma testudineum]|uniref:Malonate-semialdehyde dehydrogenase (Acetylating)/methylmalonate-semialdehyde dehydrogenase n=2 Tax=Mycoplasma testudineum TaxID=244584 RepID=A0A4R6IBI8_9MOLU|nr:aldehyde dehydrogenase family protein [Mycoplasma testudineum]OYD26481.1 methylmalonate-semialdehyde dehydrogenase [Mycoplasma testudineum]TDO18956.1 malonate-semialdehyde dehydrogenase (acetylating)/methylmalonate-semialdehyde dehydrogenase [Mycoplasma testudineum]
MQFNKKFIRSYVNGHEISESGGKIIDVRSPHDDKLLAQVEFSTVKTVDEAVKAARIAQKSWGALTFKKRSEVLYKYRSLLEANKDQLAQLVHLDNGKTLTEAEAEVGKCIELTDFACSIPQIISGETQFVSRGILAREEKRPVGVFGVITPFNFPLMVPHWSIPNAIATGNAIILKPSEQTPLATSYMAELWKEAGLPDGILNIVYGGPEIGEALTSHPEISGITFVGSTNVAKTVYLNGSKTLKRVLSLGGAKNHVFALPDADPEISAKEILSSAIGMAGQRCMALSVALSVGKNNPVIEKLVEKAKGYRLGVNFPPIVSKENVAKLEAYIEKSKKLGAKILVDGTKNYKKPASMENGYWFGPTIIDWSGIQDKMPEEEIFGPILEVVKFEHLKDAIEFQKRSPYGNSASIFTQSGRAAEEILKEMSPGMLGVNIGVPVPREPYSFGGLNSSKFGYGDITGKSSLNFWTNLVKVTTKWNAEDKADWMS